MVLSSDWLAVFQDLCNKDVLISTLDGTTIERVSSYRYLGTLDFGRTRTHSVRLHEQQ